MIPAGLFLDCKWEFQRKNGILWPCGLNILVRRSALTLPLIMNHSKESALDSSGLLGISIRGGQE
jgi:hypothetical protein